MSAAAAIYYAVDLVFLVSELNRDKYEHTRNMIRYENTINIQ